MMTRFLDIQLLCILTDLVSDKLINYVINFRDITLVSEVIDFEQRIAL